MLKYIVFVILLAGITTCTLAADSEQSPPASPSSSESSPSPEPSEPVESVQQQRTPRLVKAKAQRSTAQTLHDAWQTGGQASAYELIDQLRPGELNMARRQLLTALKQLPTQPGDQDDNSYREFVDVCLLRINENIDIYQNIRKRKAELRVPPGQAVDAFPDENNWPVYDNTMYVGKPDTFQKGFKPIQLVMAARILGNDHLDEPYEPHVRQAARELPIDRPVCIDIEHWSMAPGPDEIDATLDKFIRLSKWIREENPGVRFGFYGIPPVRAYWAPVHYHALNDPHRTIPEDSAEKYRRQYMEWQNTNQKLAPLAEHVDFIFPSLYTFYDKVDGWQIYARENIAAARQYGKPVIPFLLPAYHGSNAKLAFQPVGAEYWRTQVRTLRQLADGMAIWMGIRGRMQWEDWRWWDDVLREELALYSSPPFPVPPNQ